jgi:hypothetical protein
MKKILAVFAPLALSLLVSSAAAANAALHPHLGATVEITRSHSWCWYPTIHRFRSGEILVGITMSPDQVNAESGFSAYCLSKDGGLTWSRRYTLGLGANQDGTWSDVPDDQDQIWQWASYSEQVSKGDFTHFKAGMTKFSAGGRHVAIDLDVGFQTARPAGLYPTWLFAYAFDRKNPTPDTLVLENFGGRPWGNMVRDAQGNYYTACYYTDEVDARRTKAEEDSPNPRRYIHDSCLRSTDGGKSWTEVGTIAAVPPGERPAWMGAEGPNECSLAALPDGRLYAIYRTGKGGTLGNSWSADGGKTWTAPKSMGIAGVAPRLHRLRNGMLALVTGRPGPVALYFNADGQGKNWSQPFEVFAGNTTHYCDFLEVAPGRLLVVYDDLPYGWHEIPYSDRDARNIVHGTFVELGQ